MNGWRSEVPWLLMNLVDDATSTTPCRMGEQETIWAAVGVLRAWIESTGAAGAVHGLEERVRASPPSTYLDGTPSRTQFGRMCERLGIRIIAAGSPEAKGVWGAITARIRTG